MCIRDSALLKEPSLLLLDEPFAALDPEGRQLVHDIVRTQQQRGTTVVMATHLPEEARALCDQHIHLEAGRLVRRA